MLRTIKLTAVSISCSSDVPNVELGAGEDIIDTENGLVDLYLGRLVLLLYGSGHEIGLVAKELGSNPSLSLSGLQGSYINCEVTLTVNGKSKTFVPKAICNGKVSDGIYVRPRIG